MNGLLIVNKPAGPTSHDIVYKVRKWSNERRIGHAGTLDPMATGVLVLCMGPATRLAEYLLNGDKRYRAVVRLGQTTDTYDAQGRVLDSRPVDCTPEQIESALASFRGAIQQTPPAFSAIQVNGQRAYDLARRGQTPDLKPRAITIHSLALVGWSAPEVTLEVACSAGTYIRSLAHDLGQALGCGAHLAALTRMVAGGFTLEEAHSLDEIEAAFKYGRGVDLLRPADEALAGWPAVRLTEAQAERVSHGNPVSLAESAAGLGRAYDPQGRLIAIVEADVAARQWKPIKVLTTV